VSPPSDQKGAAGDPLPPDDPTAADSRTSEPQPSVPQHPLSKKVVYMAAGIPEALGERLQSALAQALDARRDLTLYARVDPITVRAAEPSEVTAARLTLPEAVPDLLGGEVETQVLADGERLRVWLAGADQIEPDSTVTLIAIGPGGEIAEVTAVAGTPRITLELSLPWTAAQLPEAVAIAFEQLGQAQ
jgi:hypothetical protein